MATLFSDNFAVTNQTLNGYNSWSVVAGTWNITDQSVQISSADGDQVYNTTTLSTADYKLTVDCNNISGGGSQNLLARRTASNNFYILFWTISGSTTTLYLYKNISGTFTAIASNVNVTGSANQTHSFGLSCQGTAIKSFYDGVEQQSATDSAISSAGNVGLRCGGSGSKLYDNVLVEDIAAAGPNLAKVNGIALASIAKYQGIAKASISKINGLTIQ